MIVFYLCLSLIILSSLSYCRIGYYSDYIGKDQCNVIKGIFILLIFFSHISPYIKNAGFIGESWLDTSFLYVTSHINQWVVALFLFYSGFGVMQSLQNKGTVYLQGYPRKRILTTLLNFDVAVLVFVLLNIIVGISGFYSKIPGALIAWNSIGNSNWYIFVILVCYLCFFVSFRLTNNNLLSGMILLLLLVVVMIALSFVKEYRWYNTILCFPAGVWFSLMHGKIIKFFQRHYVMALVFALGGFAFCCYFGLPRLSGLTYNMGCILFSLFVVLFTMKCKIRSFALCWCGMNLFPLYIYQRAPMIALKHLAGDNWVARFPFIYVIICLVVSLAITYFYRYWKISIN